MSDTENERLAEIREDYTGAVAWPGQEDARDDVQWLLDALDAAGQRAEKAEAALRDAWLAEIYVKDGADIWIADAERKGQSISEQLIRLEQLRTGGM